MEQENEIQEKTKNFDNFRQRYRHKNDNIHRSKTSCEPVLLSNFETLYDELVQSGRARATPESI